MIAELACQPDDAWTRRLSEPAVIGESRVAAAALGLSSALLDLALQWTERTDQIVEEHGLLFGHTVRSACPPYELEYGAGEVFQQSQALADIGGFYQAFGVQLSGALAERPDHVVPEWEFLSLLALKESRAISAGQGDGTMACRDAQRAFLKDHVACWMFGWFNRVRDARPGGYFAAVADLAEALLREWCAARSVPIGAGWLELRPVTDEDSTITCGAPGASQVELGPRLAQAYQQEGEPC